MNLNNDLEVRLGVFYGPGAKWSQVFNDKVTD